ncbi:hypothetical protein [Desulfobaculum bizertense]|uniref:Uncharacterized protein n=1 Tax=Desulfobaculum bizertense DSM 18034 TaxID=1121442 RepID=A0A1T4X2D9_9BACT|nr:hypothetical protein [Desulfobaculum bizertense]SKA83716.1 hypothetical protein SAMN02745702_02923 [Desulfobaculum bizertense DSM 18034]SKA84685.1 hypothetical protein SAMN02745702_02977 [Desulfobaculum bizertense DSM 18034]
MKWLVNLIKFPFVLTPEQDFFKWAFSQYLFYVVARVAVTALMGMSAGGILSVDSMLLVAFSVAAFVGPARGQGTSPKRKFLFQYVLFVFGSYVSALIGPFRWTRLAFDAYLLAYMWVRWGTVGDEF